MFAFLFYFQLCSVDSDSCRFKSHLHQQENYQRSLLYVKHVFFVSNDILLSLNNLLNFWKTSFAVTILVRISVFHFSFTTLPRQLNVCVYLIARIRYLTCQKLYISDIGAFCQSLHHAFLTVAIGVCSHHFNKSFQFIPKEIFSTMSHKNLFISSIHLPGLF